jgi:hypothetical protein
MKRKPNSRRRRWYQPWVENLETRLAPANVDVLSYHYDLSLSGANLQETVLHPGPDSDPTALNLNNFGRLFSQPVDGEVYAQPLYKSNLAIPGKGTHNVAFIATEHDGVYAFDADSNTGVNAAPLWQVSLIDAAHGITPMPSSDLAEIHVTPELGITGTPVIDGTGNTLYVVASTKEVVGSVAHYRQKLHALDLTTGAEKFGGPLTIGDSVRNSDGTFTETSTIMVNGGGDGADAMGHIRFSAAKQLQRAALQLLNGVVYVAWASHDENRPYHGWLVGFDKTTLQPVKWFNTSPNAGGVGIWQSGGGVSADAQGNLYFAAGNGFDGPDPANDPAHGNYTEAVLKLSTTGQLTVSDYFIPYDWQSLDQLDQDVGAGEAMLLPDFVGSTAHPHLLMETGKAGKLYLIDRDNLGHNVPPPGPDRVVQVVTIGNPGVWGNPAFFKINATTGIIYYHGQDDVLKGYLISNGHIDDNPADILRSAVSVGYPGTEPVVSADGISNPTSPANGIVWEIQTDQFAAAGPAVLRAFDARDLTQQLYSSSQAGLRDQFGPAVRFTAPVVTNGHVLVTSGNSFSVFGLFPASTSAPAPCTNLQGTLLTGTSSPQIRLTWTNPAPNPGADPTSIGVFRSTNGRDFTLVTFVDRMTTTFTDTGPFVPGQQYYYGVAAFNQVGNSDPSNFVSVVVPPPVAVLSMRGTAASAISLAWTAVANDHYDIERSTDGTNFTRVATVPAVQTTYTDSGLAAGAYAYRIHAYNVTPDWNSVSNVQGTWVGAVIDHGSGFNRSFDLTANGNALVSPTEQLLRLTGADAQTGSAFSNTPISIARFTTSFQISLHGGTQPNFADGLTFVLQANAPTALGQGGAGLGYQGIGRSVAVKFGTFQYAGDPSNSSTGLVLNGAAPRGGVDTSASLLLNNTDPKNVTLAYDGTTLTETIVDVPRNTRFTTSFTVNIPALLGSDTAYVGFTAATGSPGTQSYWELQDIVNWTFTAQAMLPGAPVNLRETATASSAIDLAWDGRSYNETGFQVERSLDGITFTPVGTTTLPSFEDNGLPGGRYTYRVKALNGQGSSAYTAAVTASPGALFSQDQDVGNVGDPAYAGSATFLNGTYTLTASGSDLGATNDHFHFAYLPIQGNGELIARLASESLGSGYAKAGLMFRQSLSADAANAFMLQFPAGASSPNGPAFQWRPDAGNLTLSQQAPDGTAAPPVWLRLVRSDTTFSGYWARDLGNGMHGPWNLLGSQVVNISTTALVGLAFMSRSNAVSFTGTATFDHVQFLPAISQASHLDVSTPVGPAIPGQPVTITVTALDPFNNVVTGYRGSVHFSSSDPQAVLPGNYAFTAADNGVHTFRVTFWTPGRQTLSVADTVTAIVRGGTQVPAMANPLPLVTLDYSAGFANHAALTTNGSAAFPGAGSSVGIFPAHQDVNIPLGQEPAGSAGFTSSTGTYTLTAAGAGLAGSSDEFHYAYQLVSGDAEIIARVASESATDFFTEAGLLVRDNLSPGAADAFMGEYGPGGNHNAPVFKWRPNQGGQTMVVDTMSNTQAPPLWLRLVRSGNVLTGYWAQDINNGQSHGPWQQLGTETIPMGAAVLVGLALASDSQSELATATFDHVSVTAAGAPVPARLTGPVTGQAGSFLTSARVGIASFTTSFTFQLRSLADPVADGLTFVIENDSRGPGALGDAAGGLGYGGMAGIHNSVALKFDSWKPAGNHSSTGLYFDGHFPGNTNPPPDVVVDLAGTGIDFAAGARATPPHSFRVDLSYDGTTLMETITDLTTHASVMHSYMVDIPAAVGGTAAYVGVTADAGGANIQDVQSWTGQFQTSAPATHLVLSSRTTSTTAGTPFQVTVTVLDRNNNQVAGYVGTVHFTSSDLQAGLPADYTFTPADAGQHTFTITLKTAGTQSLTATDTRTGSITGILAGIVVSPDVLSQLRVAGFPSPITAGTAGMLTVTATDAYGNTIAGYRGTVHFRSIDGQASLPLDYTFMAADNGVHTFSVTLKTAGTQTITATDTMTGSITGTQMGIMVNAASADHLELDAPASVPAFTVFTLMAIARDPYNNIAVGYSGTIHFTSSDPQAGLPADYHFTTGDGGRHSFRLTLGTLANQSVTATDSGTMSIHGSTTVTVTAALFNPAVDTPVGAGPQAVVVGDFNGDGIPDLAVANTADNTVTILLGNGDGTFVNVATLSTDMAPVSIAVADFNGDGILDLVVANRGSNTLTIFLGNGDGTFAPAQAIALGFSPAAVTVADVDGDGNVDLVVADPGDSAVAVLLGNGDGTFQSPILSPAGGHVTFVAVADVNGDGVPDVVAVNTDSNTISVLLGNGDGTFQFDPQQVYTVDQAPVSVAVGDFNGDGALDLVVANRGSNDVSILLGNGDGTFQAAQNYAVGSSPLSVAVGDFNGDGILDVAVANQGDNTASVLLGNGDGSFQAALSFPVSSGPAALAVADFNGDGTADLVTANAGAGTVSVLLNAGNWPSPPSPSRALGNGRLPETAAGSLIHAPFDEVMPWSPLSASPTVETSVPSSRRLDQEAARVDQFFLEARVPEQTAVRSQAVQRMAEHWTDALLEESILTPWLIPFDEQTGATRV